ncbi:MAG: tripartite tricarboxylate transporter substrate binding protein [Betaproteobacteria bacterium]|nr:tripartite tricarboxylate transporter substrate binding protein [Betaproteobacteria bacterium]
MKHQALRFLRRFTGFAAVLTFAAAFGAAGAAEWPERPITLLVPFNAGGSVDRMARGLAPYLSKSLGQPVTVVNRPGAGGQVGTTWFLQQPDDGYTLLLTPAMPYIATNILVTGAKYTLDDFAFVNAQWSDYTMLAVHKDKPYQSLKDLIDAIKANPGKLSTGVTFGSAGQISTMMLLEAFGIPADGVRVVTYDGGGPVRTALAGGHLDFSVLQGEGSETVREFIRPLAVFREDRAKEWDAPTINEALKGMGTGMDVLSGSVRVVASSAEFRKKNPKGFERLTAAYKQALENEEYRAWLAKNKIGDDWVGPEKTTARLKTNFEILKKYQHLLKKRKK